MAGATFTSDLKLIIDSILRRWDTSVMDRLLSTGAFEAEDRMMLSSASAPGSPSARVLMPPTVDRPSTADQVTAF
jgi:hypothetical protein